MCPAFSIFTIELVLKIKLVFYSLKKLVLIMKPEKILTLVFLLFMTSYVYGIDVSVGNSCGIEYEPMLSLQDTAGGHVGDENNYNTNVCISDVEYFDIKNQCGGDEKSLLSLNSVNNSHISMYDNEYNLNLCSRRLETEIKSNCNSDETKILSVTEENNTHAASPTFVDSTYSRSICLKREPPKNVTVTLSGLSGSVYADGSSLNTGETINPPVAYPYVVSEQPVGIVSYGGFQSLSRTSADTVSITQTPESGSYLLPFTKGGYQEIEDEQEAVLDRTFLNTVSPNFGFSSVETPTARVIYSSDQGVKGFDQTLRTGRIELAISKLGSNSENLTVQIQPN